MEEDKIKEIFSGYNPEISSSIDFMERLERNLQAVELIHQENEAAIRRNRLAVTIASFSGFVTGVICTLLFPYINAIISSLTYSIASTFQLVDFDYGNNVISWLLIGGVSVLVALNTYNISSSLLPQNKRILS